MNRRKFLQSIAAGSAGIVISLSKASPNVFKSQGSSLERRQFGKNDVNVSLIGLGTAQIGRRRFDEVSAVEMINKAIDLGINYIDTASIYGNAEEKIGRALKERREEVFLATKTIERSKEESWEEINRSLERLSTGRINLLQIHALNTMAELDTIMSAEGAIEAAWRAKREGMVEYIGITGHKDPDVIEEALNRFEFDAVLVPLGPADSQYHDFAPTVIPTARKIGAAVIGMKVFAAGKAATNPEASLKFVLEMPVSSVVIGMERIWEIEENAAIASRTRSLSYEEKKRLLEETKNLADSRTLWWKSR